MCKMCIMELLDNVKISNVEKLHKHAIKFFSQIYNMRSISRCLICRERSNRDFVEKIIDEAKYSY